MNEEIIEAVSDFRKACVEFGMMGASREGIDAVMSAQVDLFQAIDASTKEAERQMIERCADICDQEASIEGIAQRCAARIRALGAEDD